MNKISSSCAIIRLMFPIIFFRELVNFLGCRIEKLNETRLEDTSNTCILYLLGSFLTVIGSLDLIYTTTPFSEEHFPSTTNFCDAGCNEAGLICSDRDADRGVEKL